MPQQERLPLADAGKQPQPSSIVILTLFSKLQITPVELPESLGLRVFNRSLLVRLGLHLVVLSSPNTELGPSFSPTKHRHTEIHGFACRVCISLNLRTCEPCQQARGTCVSSTPASTQKSQIASGNFAAWGGKMDEFKNGSRDLLKLSGEQEHISSKNKKTSAATHEELLGLV